MLTLNQESQYRDYLLNTLLSTPQQTIVLTRKWASSFPNQPGVYLLWEGNELVYVGETGSIKGRMENLLNTLNHQVRRSIAKEHFKDFEGFQQGSSTRKHPAHIEAMLNDYLQSKVKVSFLTISFGRKEIEEAICETKRPLYNNRERRKR